MVILSKPVEWTWNNVLTRPFNRWKAAVVIRLPFTRFYFRPLFFNEWYYVFKVGEPYLRRELKNLLGPLCIFVDIGAHIGYHTVYARELVGESGMVVAVEPDERNSRILERNCARFGDVVIIKAAAGDVDSPIHMSFQFNPLFNTVEANDGRGPGNLASVVSIKLDDIAERFEGRKYKNIVIKIDVEGSENKVLLGSLEMLKRYRPFFIIEVANVKQIEALLRSYNYNSRQLMDSYWIFEPAA